MLQCRYMFLGNQILSICKVGAFSLWVFGVIPFLSYRLRTLTNCLITYKMNSYVCNNNNSASSLLIGIHQVAAPVVALGRGPTSSPTTQPQEAKKVKLKSPLKFSICLITWHLRHMRKRTKERRLISLYDIIRRCVICDKLCKLNYYNSY